MSKESPKLLSLDEFNKIPKENLIKLLNESKVTISKGTIESTIRDIARNKLHGTHFIHPNEEKKGDKITQKPIIIKKNYEKCPNCLQNKLILQPFPKESDLYKSKYCENCSNFIKSQGGNQ